MLMLCELYVEGDDEEFVEVVLCEVVLVLLCLLVVDIGVIVDVLLFRCVVLVVEVDDVMYCFDFDDVVVRLVGLIMIDQVVVVYVDNVGVELVVMVVIVVIDVVDLGDEDVELVVGDVQDYDFVWYVN